MVQKNVADILQNHVTLQLEGIDRMYLNGYVPGLQHEKGCANFIRYHLGHPVASTVMLAPMSRRFVDGIEKFAQSRGVDLFRFARGERKDDIAKRYLAAFEEPEGVLFIGKSQEKTRVKRTEKRRDSDGRTYPWIVSSTAMVNHYYFYILDENFGPLFIKFGSYFPYPVKVCINGNEWLKRQLDKRGISYEPLDNGIRACDDAKVVQRISDQLNAKKIDALFRKWLKRLPHPYSAVDRAAGFRYELSILQSEFALTQVLDRPVTGRLFFEEVIRDNLDIGRPDRVQLIFNRRVIRTTPGTFRTRVLTDGVTPSLHVQYKSSKIKQYHKENWALRTETTINDTYDFNIGRSLSNLPALRKIGFNANQRLLRVQYLSHDCLIGEDRFQSLIQPLVVRNQRASGLRFGDPRIMALMHALCLFSLNSDGFRHREMREHVAQLLGLDPDNNGAGRMTYDLRRLRLHGLIERIPYTHRYRVTRIGIISALFFVRFSARVFRTGFSLPAKGAHQIKNPPGKLRILANLDTAISDFLKEAHLAA